MSYVKLAQTLRLPITCHDATGELVNADALPTVVVYEDGTLMGVSPTVTNLGTGRYEAVLVCSGANGFEVGKNYSVYANAIVNAITGEQGLASFQIVTRSLEDLAYPATTGRSLAVDASGNIGADVNKWLATAVATPYTAGVPEVDVTHWSNGLVNTPAVVGIPNVNVDYWRGTIQSVTANFVPAVQTSYWGSTISTAQALLQSDLDNIQNRLPASLVSGRMDASVGAVAADAITAASIAAGAIDLATIASDLLTALFVRQNTATAGGASTITLDASAVATDSYYQNTKIYIASGTGAGQTRGYDSYVGATKVYTVDSAWSVVPDATSVFILFSNVGGSAAGTVDANVVSMAAGTIAHATFAQDALDLFAERRRSTATAGAASTITLDAGASAVDDFYKNAIVVLVSGTGVGQFRTVSSYVGATKVATVDRAWDTGIAPDATTVFELFASGGSVDAASVATAVWDADRASYATVGSFGEGINVVTIATAAANTIRDAFLNFSHDTGVTIKGAIRRLDALATNKATGLKGALARYFMRDGTTAAISAAQDTAAGTRGAADVTGSEA